MRRHGTTQLNPQFAAQFAKLQTQNPQPLIEKETPKISMPEHKQTYVKEELPEYDEDGNKITYRWSKLHKKYEVCKDDDFVPKIHPSWGGQRLANNDDVLFAKFDAETWHRTNYIKRHQLPLLKFPFLHYICKPYEIEILQYGGIKEKLTIENVQGIACEKRMYQQAKKESSVINLCEEIGREINSRGVSDGKRNREKMPTGITFTNY